jgi:hypothetical protein
MVHCALAAVTVIAVACNSKGDNYSGGTINVVVDEASSAVVMLYVSNQSFEDSEVGIVVTLDGSQIIDREFDVGDQHNWIPFRVRLSPGEHTLEAASTTGVIFTTQFEATDASTRYAVLDYWYYPPDDYGSSTPRKFGFTIQDEPVGFD